MGYQFTGPLIKGSPVIELITNLINSSYETVSMVKSNHT